MNRIVLGTELYSGKWGINFTEEEVNRILSKIIEICGHCEIDTAPTYGNSEVEKMIGYSIKKNGRENFRISTKFKLEQKQYEKEHRKEIEAQLTSSLKNMRTEYLDIYYFHSGDNKEFFSEKVWDYLNSEVCKGRIKKLGLSLKHDLVKRKDFDQVESCKIFNIQILQTVLNLYSKESLEYVIPKARDQGMEIYGRMPLAKGLLSGKYRVFEKFPSSDPRANSEITKKIINFRNLNSKMTFGEIINWPLKYADKIVLGCKSFSQFENAFNAIHKYN